MSEENKSDEDQQNAGPCAQGHNLGSPVENVRVVSGTGGSTITTYTRACTNPGCGHVE